jgi:hypothetical protein
MQLRAEFEALAKNYVLVPQRRCSYARSGSQQSAMHLYEVRPHKDKHGVDLISDALPFGRLAYAEPNAAIGYAKFYNRSHDVVIRVYDDAGNVIETHEHECASYLGDMSKMKHCWSKCEAGWPNTKLDLRFTGNSRFGDSRNKPMHKRFWFNNKPGDHHCF